MNSWLVQATPRAFDIIGYLQNHADKEDYWMIGNPSFVDKIKPGDQIFIWKSKANDPWKGIAGRAVVTSNPCKSDIPWYGKAYWRDKDEEKRTGSVPNFNVRYDLVATRKLLANPIKEGEIRKAIPGLTILRSWRRGIYPLSDEESRILDKLVGKR